MKSKRVLYTSNHAFIQVYSVDEDRAYREYLLTEGGPAQATSSLMQQTAWIAEHIDDIIIITAEFDPSFALQLTLMGHTGLRRIEIMSMNPYWIDLEAARLCIPSRFFPENALREVYVFDEADDLNDDDLDEGVCESIPLNSHAVDAFRQALKTAYPSRGRSAYRTDPAKMGSRMWFGEDVPVEMIRESLWKETLLLLDGPPMSLETFTNQCLILAPELTGEDRWLPGRRITVS